MLYVVTLTYSKPKGDRGCTSDTHKAWLVRYITSGKILTAGPMENGAPGSSSRPARAGLNWMAFSRMTPSTRTIWSNTMFGLLSRVARETLSRRMGGRCKVGPGLRRGIGPRFFCARVIPCGRDHSADLMAGHAGAVRPLVQ